MVAKPCRFLHASEWNVAPPWKYVSDPLAGTPVGEAAVQCSRGRPTNHTPPSTPPIQRFDPVTTYGGRFEVGTFPSFCRQGQSQSEAAVLMLRYWVGSAGQSNRKRQRGTECCVNTDIWGATAGLPSSGNDLARSEPLI